LRGGSEAEDGAIQEAESIHQNLFKNSVSFLRKLPQTTSKARKFQRKTKRANFQKGFQNHSAFFLFLIRQKIPLPTRKIPNSTREIVIPNFALRKIVYMAIESAKERRNILGNIYNKTTMLLVISYCFARCFHG
jgi:hypothetical protein